MVKPSAASFGPVEEWRILLANDRDEICAKIMEFIHSEMQDKSIKFDMNTPIESVKIDSIDVIHVVFKVEEEFKTTVDLPQDSRFATVGDFVRALADFVPVSGNA
jgi:acyl carrier protein